LVLSPRPAPSAVNIQPCSAGSRPAVTSLFPLLVNWNANAVLGCELSYLSTGRTVFVLHDRQGRTYFSGGPTFIPTDAGVIIVGLIGGLVAAVLAALITGGLLIARHVGKTALVHCQPLPDRTCGKI
jgi:hypothetical protein